MSDTPPHNPPLPPYPNTVQGGVGSLPPLLPYRSGLPVPSGYRVVERAASGLIIGGSVTFLASYAAGLGIAASQGFDNGSGYAAIPVAGPWAAIGARNFACKTTLVATSTQAVQQAINKCMGTALDQTATVIFLTVDGLVQATGAVMFFVGLASGYQELVRHDLPATALTLFPEGGAAFSVSGSF